MIPFNDLCASLDRYNRRRHGQPEAAVVVHELTHAVSERSVVGEAHHDDHDSSAHDHLALGPDEHTMMGSQLDVDALQLLDDEPLPLDEEPLPLDDEPLPLDDELHAHGHGHDEATTVGLPIDDDLQ